MISPRLNIPELTRVAEWLEAGGDDKKPDGIKFYMPLVATADADRRGTCGTAACIAGVVAFWHNVPMTIKPSTITGRTFTSNAPEIMDSAATILGLDKYQEAHLFNPGQDSADEDEYEGAPDMAWFGEYGDMDDVTPAIAARCVRGLINTGEINWEKAFEE